MPSAIGSGSLPFLYSDFTGGLNTLDAPFLLTDNEARDLSNVQGSTVGAIVKRGGLVTLATPAVTLTSVFPLESVSPVLLVAAGGTHLYSVSTGGTVTSIASGLTSGLPWEFVSAPIVSARGPLFGMNGTDTPKQWTGTGAAGAWTNASGAVGVPNGKYCIYAQNQVFAAGVAANPSRLYWSAIADPTNWDPSSLTGAGFADFDPNDGEAITGIGTVGPYILIGKPRKLWVLLSTATAQTRRVSETVGIASHRSIASGPEGAYFLAEDRGVYLFNGSKLTAISDKIRPTVDGIQAGFRSQCAGAYFNAHYYLSFPSGNGTNDTTLDFDATLGSWWKHAFGSNQFAVWHPTGVAQLYSAKATGAFIDQCFVPGVYQDNGANFTWTWRGPWQSPTFYRRRRFPTPYFRKRLRQIRFDGTGQIDLSIARDFSGGETLIGSDVLGYADSLTAPEVTFGGAGVFGADDGSLFGGAPAYNRGRILGGIGVANAFSLVFSGTNGNPATVTSYTLLITDRRDMIVS